MYERRVIEEARELVAAGFSRRAVARRLGVHHSTVQYWLTRARPWSATTGVPCPRCGGPLRTAVQFEPTLPSV